MTEITPEALERLRAQLRRDGALDNPIVREALDRLANQSARTRPGVLTIVKQPKPRPPGR